MPIRFRALLESKKVEFLANQFNAKLVHAFQRDPKIGLTKAQVKALMPNAIKGAKDEQPAGDEKVVANMKFEPPVEIVKKLSEADPSGEKGDYLQFIVRMYVANEFRLEDLERIKTELEGFQKYKSKFQPTEEVKNPKDLNSYKTLKHLYDMVASVADKVSDDDLKSRKQQEKEAKIEGAEIVLDDPNLRIVKLKTAKAAQLYCAGTRWCTSAASTFDYYAKQDDLYVILVNMDASSKPPKRAGMRKFQLHYRSNQVMDEEDRRLSPEDKTGLSNLPGDPWRKYLEMMIKKYYTSKD